MSTDLYTEKFESFWAVYPRRVSKLPAAKAFAKLTPDEQLSAIADVQKRTRQRWWSADAKKIAHAATYLNQQRWDDEWEDDLKYRDEALPTAPRATTHYDPGVERDKWGSIGQRVTWHWLMAARGVPDDRVDELVKCKNDTVDELREALTEEDDQREAAFTLADTILLRLDMDFGKELRDSLMHKLRKASG